MNESISTTTWLSVKTTKYPSPLTNPPHTPEDRQDRQAESHSYKHPHRLTHLFLLADARSVHKTIVTVLAGNEHVHGISGGAGHVTHDGSVRATQSAIIGSRVRWVGVGQARVMIRGGSRVFWPHNLQ